MKLQGTLFNTLMVYLFLFLAMPLAGQGVKIVEHDAVRNIMQKYHRQNHEDIYIQGWRIQIITTNNRRKMENARTKFRNIYPNINQNWEHKSPYYLVKVGAYQEKMDLQGFLLDLKKEFPGAIPIMDKIKKEELIVF